MLSIGGEGVNQMEDSHPGIFSNSWVRVHIWVTPAFRCLHAMCPNSERHRDFTQSKAEVVQL